MHKEVVPAILVKTKEELLDSIKKVMPYVQKVHIDIMDNKFVPNLTVGVEALERLPKEIKYEIHWMVEEPEKYIEKIKGKHLHWIHVETIKNNWNKIKEAVKKTGGQLGIVLNPSTSLEKIKNYLNEVNNVLIMAVNPGFSGQKYIKEVEEKIKKLREEFPDINIEVDGGINEETGRSAVKAGANILAASSFIFKNKVEDAITTLKMVLQHDEKN